MKTSDNRILELFLGLMFVAILVMIVVIVIYLPNSDKNTSSTSNVVLNSYNNYNYYEIENDFVDKSYFRSINEDKKDKVDFLDYYSYGEHEREKTVLNNYKDEFRVYVVNKDYVGGYFEVKFGFCDYYENCFSETIEKYISAGEEKMFYFVDVHEGEYDYYDWAYKVSPGKI